LDELLKGYSRTADYTKKTQELAENRKSVEAERQRIDEASRLRDQYAERLGVIEQMLSQTDKAEDLSALKENDPIGYAVRVAEQSEREKQLAAVRAERQKLAQSQQAEQGERLKAHLATEAAKLREAIPELSDEVKGEVVKRDIRDFAKSIGFSDQELTQVYDSRAVLTLYKAMQYDKLVKGKTDATKKVSQAPRMLRPGTSTPEARETETIKKMQQQLKKSGKKGDAARLFERFI
jgi:galactokinase/mevalonate kinase-like predicted kinase